MASKARVIHLTKDPSEADFLVVKVENSTDHLPGAYLSEPEAEALCADEDWKVVITRQK